MVPNSKQALAVRMLREKAAEQARLPKRSDFSGDEVCFIKQKLGPWPRALEAAGLKEPPPISAKDKSRLKRERRRQLRKQQKNASSDTT